MHFTLTLALGLVVTALNLSAQGLTEKREVMKSEILVTTLSHEDIKSVKALEHDSEVARTEVVTVVVILPSCEKDARGACNASADIVAYTPDGKVHSEMKSVSLNEGRGMARLQLTPADATGVYKVIATVRDVNARRFGKTERLFGVK